MDKQLDDYKEQIQDYLQGKLNQDETTALLSVVQGSDELQRELEQQEQLIKGFRQARVQRIESMLAGWDEEDSKTQDTNQAKVRPLWRRYGWAAAAGVLLLITFFSYWRVKQHQQQAYENLVASSYQAPEVRDPYSEMSITNEKHPFLIGFDLYFEAKYIDAARYFESFSTDDSLYIDAQIMLGISLLNAGEYQSTIDVLGPLYERSELDARLLIERKGAGFPRVTKIDLAWQLVNAYLASGQAKKAIKLLESLQQSKNGYQEQATRLLEKIQRLEE